MPLVKKNRAPEADLGKFGFAPEEPAQLKPFQTARGALERPKVEPRKQQEQLPPGGLIPFIEVGKIEPLVPTKPQGPPIVSYTNPLYRLDQGLAKQGYVKERFRNLWREVSPGKTEPWEGYAYIKRTGQTYAKAWVAPIGELDSSRKPVTGKWSGYLIIPAEDVNISSGWKDSLDEAVDALLASSLKKRETKEERDRRVATYRERGKFDVAYAYDWNLGFSRAMRKFDTLKDVDEYEQRIWTTHPNARFKVTDSFSGETVREDSPPPATKVEEPAATYESMKKAFTNYLSPPPTFDDALSDLTGRVGMTYYDEALELKNAIKEGKFDVALARVNELREKVRGSTTLSPDNRQRALLDLEVLESQARNPRPLETLGTPPISEREAARNFFSGVKPAWKARLDRELKARGFVPDEKLGPLSYKRGEGPATQRANIHEIELLGKKYYGALWQPVGTMDYERSPPSIETADDAVEYLLAMIDGKAMKLSEEQHQAAAPLRISPDVKEAIGRVLGEYVSRSMKKIQLMTGGFHTLRDVDLDEFMRRYDTEIRAESRTIGPRETTEEMTWEQPGPVKAKLEAMGSYKEKWRPFVKTRSNRFIDDYFIPLYKG